MNSSLKKYWKKPIIQQIALATIFGILGAFVFSGGQAFKSWENAVFAVSWSVSVWLTQWLGHGYIADVLDRKVPWQQQPRKRLILDFGLHVVYAFVAITLVNLLMTYFLFEVILDKPFHVSRSDIINTGVVAIVISLVISGVMTSIGFYQHLRESLAREERLKAELISYKYESLKRQINPHFLFNSLNVLSDLVVEEPDQAVVFIRKLSDVYRYVLDSRDRELVPLAEEMKLLDAYADLLRTRFESAFELEVSIEPASGEYMVPLAFQLLVENAVKHNVVSSSAPLKVSIERSGEDIIVRNPLRPKDSIEHSNGVGLENLRKRFDHFSDHGIVVSQDENEFCVTLPVLREGTEMKVSS